MPTMAGGEPVLTGVAAEAAYTEHGARVILSDALTLSDPDSLTLEGATVAIAGGLVPGDRLTVNGTTAGALGSISWFYHSGILTLSGTASLADYQALLRQVAFASASDTPGADRTINWSVNDDLFGSVIRTTHIAVTEINDAPVLAGLAPSLTILENETPHLLDGNVSLTDRQGAFDGGSVRVSGLLAEDRIAIRDQGAGAGQIGVSGSDVTYGGTIIGSVSGGAGTTFVVTLNAAADAAAVDALIENLTYATASDAPTASRTLFVNVFDADGADLGPVPGPTTFAELVGAANPFDGVDVGDWSTPAFVDLDGDGRLDLVVGNYDGHLRAFHNDGDGGFTELTGAANPFGAVSISGAAAPAFADIDGDGDFDAAIGSLLGPSNDALRWFRNDDGAFIELTGAYGPTGGRLIFGTPAFTNLDGDNDPDLVYSNSLFNPSALRNDDGVFTGLPDQDVPFSTNGIAAARPSFADVDGDGDEDLIVGDEAGQIHLFRNDGAVFTSQTGAGNPFAGVSVGGFAAPAFADLDGDGDADAVVGSSDGTLRFFENVTPRGQAIIVNVNAVNEAPTLADFAADASFLKNEVNSVPALLDADVTFGDADGNFDGGALIVKGLLAEDRVSIRDQGNGAGAIGVSGADISYGGIVIGSVVGGQGGTLKVTLNAAATSAAVDALIENLTYANASDTPAEFRTLELEIADSNGESVARRIDIMVTSVNDAPVLADVAATLAYTENDAPTFVSDALTLADPDDANLEGATVQITAGLTPDDLLTVNGAPSGTSGAISWVYDAPSGILILTGSAPLADYQALLRQVAFESASDAPGASRTIVWTTHDGEDVSVEQTTNVMVTEVNDAPLIDLDSLTDIETSTTAAYTEGDPPVRIAPRVIVSDPDMPANYGGYTLTVQSGSPWITEDQFGIIGTGTGPGQVSVSGGDIYYEGVLVAGFTGGSDGTDLVMLFIAAASQAAVELVAASISYSNSSIDPRTADRFIAFTLDDGAAASQTATAVIEVTAFNSAPELSGLPASAAFAENLVNAAPQLLGADVTLTDTEGNLAGGLVTVTGLLPEDQVTIRDQGTGAGEIGVSGSDVTYGGVVIGSFSGGLGDTLTVLLNDDATIEAVEALIGNLAYANWSDSPAASRTLLVNVVDGAGGDLGSGASGGSGYFALLDDAAGPFGEILAFGYSAPAFTDMDADGDLDLVVGDQNSFLHLFENEGGAFTELQGADNVLDGLDVDDAVTPAFVDIDGDGDLDLVAGGGDGRLQLFGNDSGAFVERVDAANPLGGIDVGDYSAPAFADLDGDGDMDLVVGSQDGRLRAFGNDGGVFTELGGAANPFDGLDFESYSAPAFVDLDGDGDPDLVVGSGDGVLRVFANEGGSFIELTGADDPFGGVVPASFATPSFFDFDGDGDPDAVVGQPDGSLRTLENGGRHGKPIIVEVIAENDAPFLFLDVRSAPDPDTSASFSEGAAPVNVAPFAIFIDPDQPEDFGGYVLTVEISGSGSEGDVLSIGNIGTGPGAISLSGSDLLFEGEVVGSFSGGANGVPLSITFNTGACGCAVETVLASIHFWNASQDPSEPARTLTFTLDDGEGGIDTALATVAVTAADDLAIANDDAASTPENAILSGNVLGNDTDPDDPLEIAEVNGQAANVGTEIILTSGAKLTLNADGTYAYNPNGRFNTLTSTSTGQVGAVNTSVTDGFTYKLVNGDTATVTITIEGVASPEDRLEGDGGDNVISGTPNVDIFQLQQGGEDNVQGGEGDDGFYFGAALSTGDVVDGHGANNDQLIIQGDYSSLYTFGESNMVNVEVLAILRGADTRFGDPGTNLYDYNLRTVDANVAAGRRLTVDFAGLAVGEDVTFDGSAETDGAFTFYAGKGDDYLIGGAGADLFVFRSDGRFTGADRVDGGGGNDELALRGDYAGANAVTFSATTMTDVEVLVILSGQNSSWGRFAGEFDYDVTTNDANVAAGRRLTVDAGQLLANESLIFDGSAETDGFFRIFGGKSSDTLIGGAGNDTICGNQGGDTLTGGGGADLFVYKTALDSTLANADAIQDYSSTLGDRIDLSKIDAKTSGTSSDAFTFIGSAAFSNVQGQLRAEDLGGGIWQVQGDVDGDGNADLHFFVTITDGDPIIASDFFL